MKRSTNESQTHDLAPLRYLALALSGSQVQKQRKERDRF